MKKIFTLFAALAMVMSMSAAKLYLTPNANWNQSNARFAAYFFGNGDKWISMTKVTGETNLYEVEAPAGYPNVIFCRMNPSASANNWNNKWNQTADLVIPTDGKNHYTVTAGTWDKGGGTWSIWPIPTEKNYVDVTITITATASASIKWSNAGDKLANATDYVAMTAGENNTYTYTLSQVDDITGVTYTIKVGDVISEEKTTSTNVTADFKDLMKQAILKGTMNDWGDKDKMTIADDYLTASIVLPLNKGSYSWKMFVGVDWLGGGKAVTRENNTYALEDGENCTLNADVTGDYTFTWTYANKTLVVTYPESGTTPEPEPTVISYVLMGVNDDWTTGIAMTVNPENANEYMLLNQPIAEGDSVKVVTLTNGEKTAYCGNVKDGVTVTITPDDKDGNIILAPGNYNFYYDVTTNNIWIAAVSETPGTPGTPDTPATYYITGNEALLGDKAWNPDAIAMTEVEGVYTHTFTAVAAGVECQLKVTKGDWVNGVWGYDNLSNTPDGVTTDNDRNIIFTLAEDGDVLVTFSEEKITITGNFAVSDEPQVITYVLMGVNDDWTTGIAMTVNPENANEYMLLNQPIAEGDSVKVVTLTNGEKTAYCGNVKDGVTVTITPDDKDGNIILAPGNYNFYYDVTTDNIWIAAVSETPGTPEPVVMTTIYLNTGGSTLWNNEGANFFAHSWKEGVGNEQDKELTLVEGDLYKLDIPEDHDMIIFLRLAPTATDVVWDGDKFWNKTENLTIPSDQNCYTITEWGADFNPVCKGTWSSYTNDDGNALDNVNTTIAPVKAIVNGQLIIIRDGVKYNVQGAVVK